MGLFSRKNSKPLNDGDKPHTNGALKSPGFGNTRRTPGSPAANLTMPEIPLPRAPDPALDPAAYLRSIYAVRERSRLVLEKARKNQLRHFTVDMGKFSETARYVVSIINVRALSGIICRHPFGS